MGDWSETGEARDREQEEVLAKLPPEHQEAGKRLLEACEGDFRTWSTTTALLALTNALRGSLGEGERAIAVDKIKQALVFYRLAVIAENTKFWYERTGEAETQEELQQLLAFAHNDALSGTKRAARILANLIRGA